VKSMKWLSGTGKASTLLDWFFEDYVHQTLSNGVIFVRRSLDSSEMNMALEVASGVVERFQSDFVLETVFQDVCMASLDSYYLVHMWFQSTRTENHLIMCSDVVELLSKLGKLNDA
jgi:hypothetical protein